VSAPTALETGAIERGIAWPARHPASPGLPLGQVERRAAMPAMVLSREHDQLCREACDPLEIAAGLEAAGLDDRRARTEYQAAGVFELAEQLWRMVPWRPAPEGPSVNLWRLPMWRAQLRGLLYALPAVLVTAATPQVSDDMGFVVLLAGTAVSVGVGQGLSVFGHLLAGRLQTGALRRLSMLAVTAAAAVAVLTALVGWAMGEQVRLCLTVGGQLLFAVSATMLMVQHRDRLLLALIAPGALFTAVALLGAWPGGLTGPARTTLVTGVPAVTVLAIALTAGLWRRRSGESESLRMAVGGGELWSAKTAALYGVGLSLAVAAPVIAAAAGRVRDPGAWLVPAGLPMTTTFGTAEYLLHRARGRAAAGLGRARTVGGFAQGLRHELRLMVGLQALTAGAVAAGVVAVGLVRGGAGDLIGLTTEFALLAPVLLLLTALMSMGYLSRATQLVCAGAAALLLPLAIPGLYGGDLIRCEVGLVAVLLAVTYRLVSARFCTVTAHR
jgi:hypothetical protein